MEKLGPTSLRKDFPEWAMISLIEPSPFEAGTAYAAIDAHKLDDFRPYVFRTTDFGKTWSPITTGLSTALTFTPLGKIQAQRSCSMPELKRRMGFSFDDGSRWQALQLNLPTTRPRSHHPR